MTLVNPDVLRELITWTPYLLSGFALNIFIAMLAMLIGTGLGWGTGLDASFQQSASAQNQPDVD
jgi:hypothetical protein